MKKPNFPPAPAPQQYDAARILAAIIEMEAGSRLARVYYDGSVCPHFEDIEEERNLAFRYSAVESAQDTVPKVWGARPAPASPRIDDSGR